MTRSGYACDGCGGEATQRTRTAPGRVHDARKQGGVSVGMVSHKCEKYETGWGKCGKKREEFV